MKADGAVCVRIMVVYGKKSLFEGFHAKILSVNFDREGIRMRKLCINDDWKVRPLSREGETKTVNLPHDAMIDEPRAQESQGEGNIGWNIGGGF